ncbi:MAG: serine/threonine protein kinase [Myxococcaceae bacterium]
MAEPGRSDTTGVGLATGDLHRGGRIGKYEILTQLSLGGMAELFLAFTAGPGGFRKYVVVKRILPDVRGEDQFVKMFLDEARITAQLSHQNIAQVFDLGDEEGLYIAMEFVAGQNLNQITAACVKRNTPVPIGFTCAVARDTSLALHYAHTFVNPTGSPSPVIHRDVAQKNIMVAYDGVTKLLDFGIAKVTGNLGRTTVGMVKGTTGYMSPEQVRGEELDGRSDLFAVGVVLHEMLTGERLFAAETETEEMTRILDAPIPPPHERNQKVSREISDVVMKALARERSARFTSGKALAKALDAAAAKTMFDQDHTATFMRELFARKMNATRALLESAKSSDEEVHSATTALREDSGAPGGLRPRAQKPPLLPPGRATKVRALIEAASKRGVEWLARSPLPAQVNRIARFFERTPLWKTIAVSVGLAVLAVVLFDALRGTPQPAPIVVVETPPPAAIGEPRKTPVANTEDPPLRRGRGRLSLTTIPSARVFAEGKEIGRTPLINHEMAENLYQLKLIGPDGRTRSLTVAVRAGKTTTVRKKLDQLQTLR